MIWRHESEFQYCECVQRHLTVRIVLHCTHQTCQIQASGYKAEILQPRFSGHNAMMPGPVFGEICLLTIPHLKSSSRSVSPVTRPIVTSSLPPHRGRTRLTPALMSLLVSALFYRSRDVCVDGAGSARLLNMTATRRWPSTLRFAPHVLRRKAVPLRRLPVPMGHSKQFSSPPGETYAPFSPPCPRGS